MKTLKELFREKPWWEKTTKELDFERKMIKRLVYGLVIFGFLLGLFMIISGLFFHI